MHGAKQNIKCVGCGERFTRAGGLMGHIELRVCPVISIGAIEARRAQKELISSFLADPEAFFAKTEDDSINGSVDGGVRLNERSDRDDTDTLSRASNVGGGVLLAAASSKAWPKLETRAFREGEQEDLLTGLQSLEMQEPTQAWGGPASTLLFPTSVKPPDTSGPASLTAQSGAEEASKVENQADFLDPKSPAFDASRFRNAMTGRYNCPHPYCGQVGAEASCSIELADHVRRVQGQHLHCPRAQTASVFAKASPGAHHVSSSSAQGQRVTDKPFCRCPSCLKIFYSTTALVQHCESPSNRCWIRHSDDYNRVLDTMTGGLLETDGEHADGTVRYQAAHIEW